MGRDFREQTIHHPDGRKDTHLLLANTQLVAMPDGTYQISQPDEDQSPGPSWQKLGWFEWLDARWLVGRSMVDGIECLIYRAPWPPDNAATEAVSPGLPRFIAAAVGAEDRLPRRLETPFAAYRYVFEFSAEVPQFPAAALAALQEDKARAERNARRYRIPQ